MQVALPLKYRLVDVDEEQPESDEEDDIMEANTVDISANGLSFLIREEIPPGTALDMRIALPDLEVPIECIGRIVRVTKSLDTYSTHKHYNYRVGVTYLAINSTDRLKLEKYCKQQKAA